MLRPWPVREDEPVRALYETNNRSLESAVVESHVWEKVVSLYNLLTNTMVPARYVTRPVTSREATGLSEVQLDEYANLSYARCNHEAASLDASFRSLLADRP